MTSSKPTALKSALSNRWLGKAGRQVRDELPPDWALYANDRKGRGPEVGLSSQSAEQKPMPALHKIPDTTRSEFFSAPAGRILSRVVGNPLLNAISIMLASTINFSWAI